jgi:hypothetical protein
MTAGSSDGDGTAKAWLSAAFNVGEVAAATALKEDRLQSLDYVLRIDNWFRAECAKNSWLTFE